MQKINVCRLFPGHDNPGHHSWTIVEPSPTPHISNRRRKTNDTEKDPLVNIYILCGEWNSVMFGGLAPLLVICQQMTVFKEYSIAITKLYNFQWNFFIEKLNWKEKNQSNVLRIPLKFVPDVLIWIRSSISYLKEKNGIVGFSNRWCDWSVNNFWILLLDFYYTW